MSTSLLSRLFRFTILGFCAALFGCHTPGDQVARDPSGVDDPLVVLLLIKDHRSAARLLAHGYPVGGRALFRQAPAYWVITEGDGEGLRLLIKFGLNVNYDWGKEEGSLLTNAVQLATWSWSGCSVNRALPCSVTLVSVVRPCMRQ